MLIEAQPLPLPFGADPSQGAPPPEGLSDQEISAVMALQRPVRTATGLSEGGDGAGCVICLQDWTEETTVVPLPNCGHCMHPECLGPWLRVSRTCPCCRSAAAPTSTG